MSKGPYDYSKLRGKIREVYSTQAAFAKALGMGKATISLKLCNKKEWKQTEMLKALTLLNEDVSTIGIYFFKKNKKISGKRHYCQ